MLVVTRRVRASGGILPVLLVLASVLGTASARAAEPSLVITTATFGPRSQDGAPSTARFLGPHRLCTDGANLYVSDTGNHTIRMINLRSGEVKTLAGSPGSSGSADGQGGAARFNAPMGIAYSSGLLFVADSGNSAIRQVNSMTGDVVTLAGKAGEKGNVDGAAGKARFGTPSGIAAAGSFSGFALYVTDAEFHTVRKFDGNEFTTLAGSPGTGGFLDGSGAQAKFNTPAGLVTDAEQGGSSLYVADRLNRRIRKIDTQTRAVTTLAGSGQYGTQDGSGTAASFTEPSDLAGGGLLGGFYVLDGTAVRYVRFDGGVSTSTGLAATGIALFAQNPDAVPYLFSCDSSRNTVDRWKLSGGSMEQIAGVPYPYPWTSVFAADGGGNAYFASSNTVLKWSPSSGQVSVVASLPANEGIKALATKGQALFMATQSHAIYKADLEASGVSLLAGKPGQYGFADGAGDSARFLAPMGLAADDSGNLYVADAGNRVIRQVVVSTGQVTTIAGKAGAAGVTDGTGADARFMTPASIAFDGVDGLYAGDQSAIRKIQLPAGRVSTPVRWPGFSSISAMGIAGQKLYFTTGSTSLGSLDLVTGVDATVAGKPGSAGMADGAGDAARFRSASGLAVLPDGKLVIGDAFIRLGSVAAGAPFFVPVVLSADGLNDSHFTTELTLTNRGKAEAVLSYKYTAQSGGGSGDLPGIGKLEPGRQFIIRDVIEFLRSQGLAIAGSGPRLGTLWITFDGVASADVSVTARTTTPVVAAEAGRGVKSTILGRAGLAYSGLPPAKLLTSTCYLSGLRVTSVERSNIAVQNAGSEGDLSVRISLFAGDMAGAPVGTQTMTLGPGGFGQARVDSLAGGASSGQGFFAKVERVSGSSPFYAYGTINDNPTSDGSFISPFVLDGSTPAGLTLPVALEATPYATEVIVNNFGATTKRARISYFASAISGGETSIELELPPGSQRLVPDFVDYLRRSGASGVGAAGTAFVGPVVISVDGGNAQGLALSAKTTNPSPAGGGFLGLYYQAVPFRSTAPSIWISGLQQDSENRSNLALVNTGEDGTSPIEMRLEYFSGVTGLKVGEKTLSVPARQLVNLTRVLLSDGAGAPQGYVRVSRISGENPFIAYGVINDGAAPGERTSDGAFLVSENAQ
ncbi:MAG: hypothetical protein L6R30_18225 [Thermoanaerobaculia bacterium]|nr:hypothetical protein [Thermoanaerobaculia bacterium]